VKREEHKQQPFNRNQIDDANIDKRQRKSWSTKGGKKFRRLLLLLVFIFAAVGDSIAFIYLFSFHY